MVWSMHIRTKRLFALHIEPKGSYLFPRPALRLYATINDTLWIVVVRGILSKVISTISLISNFTTLQKFTDRINNALLEKIIIFAGID